MFQPNVSSRLSIAVEINPPDHAAETVRQKQDTGSDQASAVQAQAFLWHGEHGFSLYGLAGSPATQVEALEVTFVRRVEV